MKNMKILYVTTFHDATFDTTAKQMILSFLKTRSNGDMLVCSENMTYDPANPKHLESKKMRGIANKSPGKITVYNITNDPFLLEWIEKNKINIPTHMGGIATKLSCPRAYEKANIRTAGWFRKIAAMKYARDNFSNNYDCFIFVDSDCIFLTTVPTNLIIKAFGNSSLFYHLGKNRIKKGMGVETGFTGFKLDEVGLQIMQEWFDKYENFGYFKHKIWHDSSMLYHVLNERDYKGGIDLVKDYNNTERAQSHVIYRGIFKNYIEHYKGTHKRMGIGRISKK